MEFKSLYNFTLDEEKEVEKETERKNRKTGKVTKVKKVVKEKTPIEIFVKKPTRRQIEDAQLEYSVNLSKCVKKGILTKAMLIKKYSDTGGYLGEEDAKIYAELLQNIIELQNEYIKLDIISNPTEKQKAKMEQVKTELAENKRDLVTLEATLNSLFDHTADVQAQNKTLLWYALNLTYIQKEEDENPVPYFLGDSLEEKEDDYYEKEEDPSDFYLKLINKVSTVLAFWFFNQASSKEEFDSLIKDMEKSE